MIIESVARATRGLAPFEIRPLRFATLPDRGTPRLVVLDLEPHPIALELHERLVRRLARRPSDKPRLAYRPHLTLARFARHARPPRVEIPASLPVFPVDRLRLIRSVLRPEGAEHREVGVFPLEP